MQKVLGLKTFFSSSSSFNSLSIIFSNSSISIDSLSPSSFLSFSLSISSSLLSTSIIGLSSSYIHLYPIFSSSLKSSSSLISFSSPFQSIEYILIKFGLSTLNCDNKNFLKSDNCCML